MTATLPPPSDIRVPVQYPGTRTVKVKIRGDQHARLHSLKMLGRGSIETIMRAAVDHYLSHLEGTELAQGNS